MFVLLAEILHVLSEPLHYYIDLRLLITPYQLVKEKLFTKKPVLNYENQELRDTGFDIKCQIIPYRMCSFFWQGYFMCHPNYYIITLTFVYQ